MRFASSTKKEPNSSMTFDEEPNSSRGINIMSHVVKRKIQKTKLVVEYNKRGIPHGKAAVEMQSYIWVLTHTRVLLVDKKWTELPKDTKKQIWEAIQMANVVGQGSKKLVLSSAVKKWKDYKSTLLKQFILPFTNDKEKLKEPPQLYTFIETRLGCFCSFKKARLIDELKKQVSDGTLTVSGSNGSNAVLTMALGTPKHGGRVRGMLKHPISSIPIAAQEQSPKNPMFDKASCSGATTLVLEDENPELDLAEAQQDEMFATMVEIGATVIAIYIRYLFEFLKMTNMVKLFVLVIPRSS
ncbi:hypothetical protein L3X38_042280 [Prunus dulcis]|uniref:Uncharacterized protein n=1 Tax=Prunus dulcis TaxID=3755 RepID=A0AAD4UW00_PRUDU|nr:hypothetical protein L3X38_042280 [Prunus dulcis]